MLLIMLIVKVFLEQILSVDLRKAFDSYLLCPFIFGSCTRSRKTQSRMDTIPNGHHPECTQSRMYAIPNVHNPECTQSRMDTIPNGHHPEWTQSQMDTIPNGHHPEWTPSRMSTYSYIVTLVFYSYCLARSLLRRRGFKQILIL